MSIPQTPRHLLAIECLGEFHNAIQHFVKPEQCLTDAIRSERYLIATSVMFALFIEITAKAHNNYDPAELRDLCAASFDRFFDDPHNLNTLEKLGAASKDKAP